MGIVYTMPIRCCTMPYDAVKVGKNPALPGPCICAFLEKNWPLWPPLDCFSNKIICPFNSFLEHKSVWTKIRKTKLDNSVQCESVSQLEKPHHKIKCIFPSLGKIAFHWLCVSHLSQIEYQLLCVIQYQSLFWAIWYYSWIQLCFFL